MTWSVLALGAGVLATASALALRAPPTTPQHAIPGEGDRVMVEVLNGAAVDGLARETTRRLRTRGIDVVYFGTAWDSVWKTTEILVRRGDTAAGWRVREVLGTGEVLERPDARRLLDVTVILGEDLAGGSSGSGHLDP